MKNAFAGIILIAFIAAAPSAAQATVDASSAHTFVSIQTVSVSGAAGIGK